jgi:hypothetical protein
MQHKPMSKRQIRDAIETQRAHGNDESEEEMDE